MKTRGNSCISFYGMHEILSSLRTYQDQDQRKTSETKKHNMSEENNCGVFEKALVQNGKSELGLKSHWDEVFSQDLSLWTQEIAANGTILTTKSEKPEDVDDSDDDEREIGGHCWFGSLVSKTMVELVAPHCCSMEKSLSILDIGTGNGDLLFRLAKKLLSSSGEYSSTSCEARFIGMDYCQDAITLAKTIAHSRLVHGANVEWVVDDALNVQKLPISSMDIILDKGTFDAIASNGCSQMVQQYVKSLARLGKLHRTLLCITSANFVLEELNNVLELGGFTYFCHVTDYPTFKFNGVTVWDFRS